MDILAIAMALFSVVLLCLAVHDILKPAAHRPAIPLVWLSLAVGMSAISLDLWTMAQTWGLRSPQLPSLQTPLLLVIGSVFLFAGAIGFVRACDRRLKMHSDST